MLIAYIVSMIVGGGLVLMTAISGHGHHDVDLGHHDADLGHGDADASHDSDHGSGDADLWLPFLSLRFWTYGIAAFGFAGTLLVTLANLSETASIPWSIGTGLLCGLAVSYLTRLAMRSETDSSVKTHDMLGKTASVLVPVRPGLPGKVRLNVKGDWIEVLALPHEAESIEAGEDVVVLTVENDRAYVMKKSDLTD